MQQSDSIKELAKALCNVQSQLEGAKKDQTNPFFKAKYADLASVWGACRDLLGKNNLAVVQTTSVVEGREFVLDTTLLHVSGEWISGQLSVPLVKSDPQGLGSAFTYARRYALSAIVGICPEDDDAESATPRTKPEPTKKPLQEPAKPPLEATRQATDSVKPASKPVVFDGKQLGMDLQRLAKEAPGIWEIEKVKTLLKLSGGKGEKVNELLSSLKPLPFKEFVENVKLAISNLDTKEIEPDDIAF